MSAMIENNISDAGFNSRPADEKIFQNILMAGGSISLPQVDQFLWGSFQQMIMSLRQLKITLFVIWSSFKRMKRRGVRLNLVDSGSTLPNFTSRIQRTTKNMNSWTSCTEFLATNLLLRYDTTKEYSPPTLPLLNTPYSRQKGYYSKYP